MSSHPLHRITASHVATGLYLQGTAEGWHVYRVDLRRQKDSLEVEALTEEETTLEALAQSLPAGRPLYVALEAKGILHRQVEEAGPNEALAEAFPNLDPSTVWTQEYPVEDGVQLSVVRRDQLSPWLDVFAQQKRFVWSVQLGPWGAHLLAPALERSGAHALQVGNHTLQFEGGAWKGTFSYDGLEPANAWTLGDRPLAGGYVPAYA
ncbi:MAG TPA: hypothetical protein DCR93_35420, partial [Cytophagales bacterium]|nr:hypothetical protein [Cytophagales bacterium]